VECEDSSIAMVSLRNTLIVGENEINISDMLPAIDYFVLYENGKLYGLDDHYLENNNYKFEIFVLDVENGELEILHTENCTKPLPDIQTYEKCYYFDRNIAYYNGIDMTVYNLDTSEVRYLPVDDPTLPEQKYKIDRLKKDDGEIDYSGLKISSKTEERIITLQYMAERNEYAKELYNLETESFLGEKIDPLKKFFYKYTIVDNRIYLICRILEKDGESNAVVFRYDFEEDNFEYIYRRFTRDTPQIQIFSRE
jgi:hypothetical protein